MYILRTSQTTRQQWDDLRWMNKFDGKFKDNKIKKHEETLNRLKMFNEEEHLQQ